MKTAELCSAVFRNQWATDSKKMGGPIFAGQLFLPYPTVPGFNYVLQSRADLSPGSWSNGSPIGGDGAWRIPTVPSNGAHAFYRLEVSPAR
jgi:hypothetical protein